MGILFVPPEMLVMEALLASGPINWTLILSAFIGCYVVGGFLLWLGLRWSKIQPKLSSGIASSINSTANNGLVWIVLLVLLVFGPPTLVGWFSHANMNQPGPPPAASFVDPVHDDAVKWRIAEGIRAATIAGLLSAKCHVTIVTLQEPYAEDYAVDLRRILDVVNWEHDERFAAGPVDRGITVRGVTDQIQSRACAVTLANQLKSYARTRSGGSIGDPLRWTMTADAPDYLKQCPEGLCIEVDFGNDDSR